MSLGNKKVQVGDIKCSFCVRGPTESYGWLFRCKVDCYFVRSLSKGCNVTRGVVSVHFCKGAWVTLYGECKKRYVQKRASRDRVPD